MSWVQKIKKDKKLIKLPNFKSNAGVWFVCYHICEIDTDRVSFLITTPRSQYPCLPLLSPSWNIIFVSLFFFSPIHSPSPFLFDLRHFAHNMSLHSTVCDCRIYIWNVQERSWNMLERWHVEGQAMMLVDFNVPRWRFAIYLFSYYFNCTILLCF